MKKKIILLMTIVMSIFILVGCTDKEEKYSNDQENLQKIIRLNQLVEDTYAKARQIETEENISDFNDYCDKILNFNILQNYKKGISHSMQFVN